MNERVGIVCTGDAGNITSVLQALMAAGSNPVLITQKKHFAKVDKIVLPGVGGFKQFMDSLRLRGLEDVLVKEIYQKPTLGICLGMQVLAQKGFEFGETKGLNIFKNAEVKKMHCGAPVPHMGFSSIKTTTKNQLFRGLGGAVFYFMHSFEVIDYEHVLSLSNYGSHQFVSSVVQGNIFGVQFHPEKSREPGIELFKNFLKI